MKTIVICKKDVIMEDGKTQVFTKDQRYEVEGLQVMNDNKEDHCIILPGHDFFNNHFDLLIK